MVKLIEQGNLLALAERLEACAEDAKRGEPVPGYGHDLIRPQPAAIISLANAVLAIAAALRARAQDIGEVEGE